MSEWQDISDSPDEKAVLVFVPGLVGSEEGPILVACRWYNRWVNPHDSECNSLYYKPSHWMPLPASPA